MDWQKTLTSLDGVPELYLPLYSRDGDEGDFVLDSNISALLDSINNLNTTNRAIRAENRDAKKLADTMKADGFESYDDVKARITELEEKSKPGADDKEDSSKAKADADELVQRRLAESEAKWSRELEAEKEINAKLSAALDKNILAAGISTAISATNAIPQAMEPVLEKMLKIVEEDGVRSAVAIGPDGEPLYDTQGRPLGPQGLAEKLRADTEHYGWGFKADEKRGAGSNPNPTKGPGNTVNPFAKETRNLTEASRLLKEHPARAQALAQAANFDLSGITTSA